MPDLDYAKVIQRLGLTVGDTDDVGDDPDTIWCDGGSVQIVPLNTYVKVADGSPVPWTGGNAVIECEISDADYVDPTAGGFDGAGYLVYNGKPFVWVVDLSSEKVNPYIADPDATHRINYNGITADGTAVSFPSVKVRITAAGDGVSGAGINDLTILSPVDPGAATPIVRGPTGVSIESLTVNGLGELEVELDDGSTVNAGELPVGPGGTDAGVGGYMGTEGSVTRDETRALVTADIGDSGSDIAGVLSASYVRPTVILYGPFIDYTGATDCTDVVQAMIDAAPQGADIRTLAYGVLKFENLTVDQGKRLIGSGFQIYRDAFNAFGDAEYLDDQWFGGTVLRSTATSGAAITLLDQDVTGGALKGFVLIGPGTGTSTGVEVGDASDSVIDPDIDIVVYNFSRGMYTRNTQEGTIKLKTRGCVKGADFGEHTNNVKLDVNFQKGTDGATTHTTTLGLTFPTPICQALTGTGLSIEGTAHTIINPYHESNTGIRAIDFVSGARHTLITPSLNTTPDTVRIQSACTDTRVIGIAPTRLADESATTVVDTPRTWNIVGTASGTQGWFSGTIATGGTHTATAHGMVVGQPVTFTTTPDATALPARGSSATYYVESVPTADTFTLSATAGGAAITSGFAAGAFTGLRGAGFKNSYVNASGKTTKYRRSVDGMHLELSGGIDNGASNTVIFTLPSAEFMPLATRIFPVYNADQGTVLFGSVSSVGEVKIVGGSATDQRWFDVVIPLDA